VVVNIDQNKKMSESVQTFGRKVNIKNYHIVSFPLILSPQKTATAAAFIKKGTGLIKVNGSPISLVQPEILKLKTYEPLLLLGADKFANVRIFS
jgi:hypothetical protein